MRVSHTSRSTLISSHRISSLVTSRHLFRSYPSGPPANPRHCGVFRRAHYPFRTLLASDFPIRHRMVRLPILTPSKSASFTHPLHSLFVCLSLFRMDLLSLIFIIIRVILYTSHRRTLTYIPYDDPGPSGVSSAIIISHHVALFSPTRVVPLIHSASFRNYCSPTHSRPVCPMPYSFSNVIKTQSSAKDPTRSLADASTRCEAARIPSARGLGGGERSRVSGRGPCLSRLATDRVPARAASTPDQNEEATRSGLVIRDGREDLREERRANKGSNQHTP